MLCVCMSNIVFLISFSFLPFKFVQLMIQQLSLVSYLLSLWFACRLCAYSKLVWSSLSSSCTDVSKTSFLLILARRLTSVSVVCRSSVLVDESFLFLLIGFFAVCQIWNPYCAVGGSSNGQ